MAQKSHTDLTCEYIDVFNTQSMVPENKKKPYTLNASYLFNHTTNCCGASMDILNIDMW